MSVIVVDASAIAAVLFDEDEAEPVLASIRGTLIAPSLLPYELASVCTTKLARHLHQAQTILSRYRLFPRLDIELTEPQWHTVPQLAIRWGLSAYDACYLQLALERGAALVTLDARLARAYDQATA
jgi:predicted nucleic acid-binding protein